MAGIDVQSQEAYEMASRGLVRPGYQGGGKHAVVYSIKSVDFEPPDLTIELHTVNENGAFLTKLIHDIGIDLRCGAACAKLRRLRFGHFNTTHALVHQQWNCDSIISNIEACRVVAATSMLDYVNQKAALVETQSKLIPSSTTSVGS